MDTQHTTMRAVRGHRRGGPERLTYDLAPRPTPAADEVLVAVRSAAITRGELDWDATWTDRFDGSGSLRLPIVPAKEVSGQVVEVGSAVRDLSVGDEVFGLIPFTRDGAAAEFTAVPADVLAVKPPSLDHDGAAALALPGLTAWQGLVRHAGLQPGDTVLVHGAAGGVGSTAVQIAVALGATVVATARAKDAEFVRTLGAERVIDYAAQRFESAVAGVAVVFDTVGGDTQARSWQVLRDGGTLVSIVSPPGPGPADGTRGVFFVVEPDRTGLVALSKLVEEGRLVPYVDRIVPLQDTSLAYSTLEREHHQGKIVVRVS
ncbi:NADP-dependent oxidoreductase [Streptomyces sp. NPDC005574]|uniref:NADP-dependent oxidoreductase n=1 Tax=Streptomyces sp. NPDC005574 TaxID=3156891 RepID=UPI0033A792CC